MTETDFLARSETYTVLLQPEPEGGYTVTCPALPGVVSYGETLEEARRHAIEAIEVYLESLAAAGEPLPEGDAVAAPLAEQVQVRRPA